jgi:hypothetical protein
MSLHDLKAPLQARLEYGGERVTAGKKVECKIWDLAPKLPGFSLLSIKPGIDVC